MSGRESRLKPMGGFWAEKCSEKNLPADEAWQGLGGEGLGALAGDPSPEGRSILQVYCPIVHGLI